MKLDLKIMRFYNYRLATLTAGSTLILDISELFARLWMMSKMSCLTNANCPLPSATHLKAPSYPAKVSLVVQNSSFCPVHNSQTDVGLFPVKYLSIYSSVL